MCVRYYFSIYTYNHIHLLMPFPGIYMSFSYLVKRITFVNYSFI
jgi:hypothetical protein